MSVRMATERWTSTHAWRRASDIVIDTYPPMYSWECSRCGQYATANRPPKSECPGRSEQNTERERDG